MDRHLLDAFIESLTDIVTDKVVQRLRPPANAIPQHPAETPEPASGATPGIPASAPEYLTTQEAASLLGVTRKGLEGMRAKGTGPKFTRVGGAIRYRRSDLA